MAIQAFLQKYHQEYLLGKQTQKEFLLGIKNSLDNRFHAQYCEFSNDPSKLTFVLYLKVEDKEGRDVFLLYNRQSKCITLHYAFLKERMIMSHQLCTILESMISFTNSFETVPSTKYKIFIEELSEALQIFLKPNSVKFIGNL